MSSKKKFDDIINDGLDFVDDEFVVDRADVRTNKKKFIQKFHDKIRADYKAGLPKDKILAKYAISDDQYRKITKGIQYGVNADIIQRGLEYELLKSLLPDENEKNAVEVLVHEKARLMDFFDASALTNQLLANKELTKNPNFASLEAHSEITARNKKTIFGDKGSDKVNVNINSTQVSNDVKIEFVDVEDNTKAIDVTPVIEFDDDEF
jgi:hypothetical protein